MIRLRNLRLNSGEKESKLPKYAAKAMRISPDEILSYKILKKSLDARKKADIHWLYTLAIDVPKKLEKNILTQCSKAEPYEAQSYQIKRATAATRPVVIGFGPAGMFAALLLAEAGLCPIVLERGGDVDSRSAAVQHFWNTGELNERTNVQFGEGGAGTFSDGKLNTGTHDGRIAFVLEQFHRFGAPECVCYDAKPHVGTDVLASVVKRLRERVLELGGKVHFYSCFTGFETDEAGISAITGEGPEGVLRIPCRDVILAPGHSARDTFRMLHSRAVPMERKAFAMGVRIEHHQDSISFAQYGENYVNLPAADYKLNVRLPDGSSAYTFCMCPGGYVVAAASEAGGVCTNGMSYSGRSGENSNAALLVSLQPEDFPGQGVLAGVEWQQQIERMCFEAGGGTYFAPAQTVGDFLEKRPSSEVGDVEPSYRPGVRWCDLRKVLPQKLTDTMAAAIPELGKKLKGFDDPNAVLTAPETRSSSPVRILRDHETLQSSIVGLYPCGEGAGYAGGITSAAVDGMKCAEKIIEKYQL